MATAKLAIGSVMDTVSATANSVSALINTATKGVGMLDAIVTKTANEQRLRHKAAAHTFVKQLIRDSAEAEAIANLQVVDFCNKSDDHKKLYQSAYDDFSAILIEPKASE